MAKPNYLDLITQRVESNARTRTRLFVSLDPEMSAKLKEARQQLDDARLHAHRAEEMGAPIKMGDQTVLKAAKLVADLEQAARETTLVVVVQALSDVQELEASAVKDEANQAPYLRRRLELGFVRAESVDGEAVPDVTVEHWAQILAVMTAPGELATWSQELNRAGKAFDFPTLAR